MGTEEESTPAKVSKPASSTQEIPTTPSYPDWLSSMQAYYGAGATPPAFFASTGASPTSRPYLWGSQHPLIPPYGPPVPYPAFYPTGGVYTHHNITMTSNTVQTSTDLESKGSDGKDQASAKKFKGTSGTKPGESEKAASSSGNDGASQSSESGSDGSSDGDNTDQQEFAVCKRRSFNQMLADANAQNNNAGENIQASVPGKSVVSMPATNLNIGMDLWNASSAAGIGATKVRPNPSGSSSAVAATMPEQWIQDECELKRQKRKQSNRESARRSRLRKQAECDELQARVVNLTSHNHTLKDELKRLSEECDKLKTENDSIEEELTRLYGPDAVANLEQNNTSTVLQSNGGEENS